MLLSTFWKEFNLLIVSTFWFLFHLVVSLSQNPFSSAQPNAFSCDFFYHTINGNRKQEIFSNFTWLFHMACFVLTINEKWKQEHNMSLLKTMPLVYDRWLCGNHPAFYSRNWNNLWRLKSCQYWEFILASFVTNNVLHSVIFEPCRWTCKVVLVFAFMFLDYAIVFEW